MVERQVLEIETPFSGKPSSDQSVTDRIKELKRTNLLWGKFSPLWEFYLSAYEGGQDFMTGDNVFKHVREQDDDYADRVKRVHNLNYCEPLVDFFTNFIFSESIDRSGGSNEDFFNEFVQDVNKKGDSIDDFSRQICDDMQIFGMSYILVDAPPRGEEVISKQQEKELGLRPYWVLIKPAEIIDWVVDDFGKFMYVKRRQERDEYVGGSVKTVHVFTEYWPDMTLVTKVDLSKENKPVILSEELFPNDLNEIPLVVARYKRSKKFSYIGLSFLKDFAYNNREIMNLTSLLQEFLYRQAFNILTKQVDSVSGVTQEEGEFGSSNFMEYSKETDRPQYISPPAEPAQFIQDERSRITNEMFKRAAQDFVGEIFNGERASGFSQAQSFSKTVPFISSRADTLETAENQLMVYTMRRMGKEWDGKIKYKDRYELTNLADTLTQFKILARDLHMPSETFVKEELKRLVREFDGKIQKDKLAVIEKEIEEFDFETWKNSAPDKGGSAADQQKDKSTGTLQEAAAEARSDNTAATKKLLDAAA